MISIYILISFILHLLFLIWGNYQDLNNSIKYTDIDYLIFTDSSKYLLNKVLSNSNSNGEGILNEYFNLRIGNIYLRETYRYTPLISILNSPNLFLFNSFGKILFSISDLIIGYLLFNLLNPSTTTSNSNSTSSATKIVGLIWLLNPIIINISTRGSSESLLGVIVITLLTLAYKKKWNWSAIVFGLAVHFKVYPIIYGSSLLAAISTSSSSKKFINSTHIKFAIISFSSFMSLNLIMYSIWGQPFLENTFLYHIKRLDHRHNFSPYFYPFYLSSFEQSSNIQSVSIWSQIIRNPLAAFLPQLGLSISAGFLLGSTDLAFAWFVQTFIFVTFNKVCTSQYFLWYLWLLPPILPNLKMSRKAGIISISTWILGQALWLSQAYRLEMLGESNYLLVWAAGVLFFIINCSVLAFVISCYSSSKNSLSGKSKISNVASSKKL